jgi:hypothetical protein
LGAAKVLVSGKAMALALEVIPVMQWGAVAVDFVN